MASVIDCPSPNHEPRPDGAAVDILLLHYTGMRSAEAALSRMIDPAAKVSAHYMIDEDGSIYRLVEEDRRAWHAGVAAWAGASDVNGRSIGIELVNPGHEYGYRAFTEPQMAALIDLAGDVLARHPIPPARVLGHSDVAPARKQDPGELFDWPRLASTGIGLWPERAEPREAPIDEVQALLGRFGYEAPQSGTLDDATLAVISAFQRHFRPRRFDGVPDAETVGRLSALVRQLD